MFDETRVEILQSIVSEVRMLKPDSRNIVMTLARIRSEIVNDLWCGTDEKCCEESEKFEALWSQDLLEKNLPGLLDTKVTVDRVERLLMARTASAIMRLYNHRISEKDLATLVVALEALCQEADGSLDRERILDDLNKIGRTPFADFISGFLAPLRKS